MSFQGPQATPAGLFLGNCPEIYLGRFCIPGIRQTLVCGQGQGGALAHARTLSPRWAPPAPHHPQPLPPKQEDDSARRAWWWPCSPPAPRNPGRGPAALILEGQGTREWKWAAGRARAGTRGGSVRARAGSSQPQPAPRPAQTPAPSGSSSGGSNSGVETGGRRATGTRSPRPPPTPSCPSVADIRPRFPVQKGPLPGRRRPESSHPSPPLSQVLRGLGGGNGKHLHGAHSPLLRGGG